MGMDGVSKESSSPGLDTHLEQPVVNFTEIKSVLSV